jgi:hypothetical protein
MADQHNLSEIRDRLKKLEEDLFDIANDFAVGVGGLPKNGAVAVALHQIRNNAASVLKALDDPAFAEKLSSRQLHEHARRGSLRHRQ